MQSEKNTTKLEFSARSYLLLSLISLAALATTFLVSSSELSFSAKLIVFVTLVFVYLLACVVLYRRQLKQTVEISETNDSDSVFDAEIKGKLLALEEVHRFFAASLKSADMFRLISNRVGEIIPNADCAFFQTEKGGGRLKIAEASSEKLNKSINRQNEIAASFIDESFRRKQTQTIDKPELQESFGSIEYYKSAIAVPLEKNGDAFGVFALFTNSETAFDSKTQTLAEAIVARVAPLLYGARTFEENVANALTDALTGLPNERGFFLVLENQIAEAQRYRSERPLTVLAIDIKNFDEHNQRFGHANGDRLLIFCADKIKTQLRAMDLLARSSSDEFIAVLPTASDEITREIIERIERTFVTSPFNTGNDEKIYLQLCFGAASFGRNGETAETLLKNAVSQKQFSKLDKKDGNILRFPKEYVN